MEPRRRGRPPKVQPVAAPPPEGMVRVEIISHLHAFDGEGKKYWCGETPLVPRELADDWIKHTRARAL